MDSITKRKLTIGQMALLVTMVDTDKVQEILERGQKVGFKVCRGQVGTMAAEKVISAVEVASKREGLITYEIYREEHALYHAILDAMAGFCRGQIVLGPVLRTVGLTFAVVRGPRVPESDDKDWIAVAIYGTVGPPVKGFEHEAVGLGINHI